MADSTLSVTWTSCNTAIARELGMSTDPSSWTDSSVSAKLDYVRQSAERSFYYALLPGEQGQVEWSFLNPPSTLNLVAGTSTYTLPDDFAYIGAIGPRLVYAAGTGYVSAEKVDAHTLTEAQARESGSTLSAAIATTGATSLTVASSKNFPINLVPFTVMIDSEYLRVTAVSGTTFTVTRGYNSTTAATHSSGATVTLLGPPKRFAVRPKASTPTAGAGQRFELLVFPTPDMNATVSYRYNVIPDAMTSTNPYPSGGAIHGETLMLACLARAELLVKGEPGPKTAEFKQQLGASITMDRRARANESEQFPMAPALLGSWGWVAQEVGRKLDLGANPALWSWSDLEKVRVAIQRGVIEVLKPADTGNKRHKGHRWSWLNTLTTVTTSAPYSTSTVTIANGVATLSTASPYTTAAFPSWAGDGTLVVSGVMYDVSTRDSDTQVTLVDTNATASAGSTYTLGRYRYSLGGTFSALSHDHLTFSPGIGYPTIKVIDPDTLREQQQSGAQYSYPWFASVRTKTPATTGTTRELVFWPIPNAAFLVTYKTKRSPLEYSDGDYLPGGTDHANLWVSAALAQIDKSYYPQFIAELGASIELDQLDQQTHNLGPNRDHSDDQNIHQLRRHWRVQSGSLFGGSYPT